MDGYQGIQKDKIPTNELPHHLLNITHTESVQLLNKCFLLGRKNGTVAKLTCKLPDC